MHITQFAHMNGTTVNFKPGDPILGNCAHLEQTLYLVVASGLLEGHFQQRMVQGPGGQMAPLSPEIQLGDDGKVEMVYSSSVETKTFQSGSLIEVRPGCAYALKALTDGILISYLMPTPFTKPLFGETIGAITEAPLKDDIAFELLKASAVTVTAPQPEHPTSASNSAPTENPTQNSNLSPIMPEPLPQRYFYREEGTGMIKVMVYAMGLLFLFGLLFSSHNPLLSILYLAGLLYGGYWLVLEILQLYKKPYTLGVEEEGLSVNNLTYSGLFIQWEDIDRLQMGAIGYGRYETEGELVIEIIPKDPNAYGKYLNPLSRLLFDYCLTHDTDYTMPIIRIKQSAVTVDLNDLLPQLISKKLSHNYAKIEPQRNA